MYRMNVDKSIRMSRFMGKPTLWFPNRSDVNRPVQAQKRARSLEFRIEVEEELYYLSSENKGADQLRGYREADLRLFFFAYADCWFSHEAAYIKNLILYRTLHAKYRYSNNASDIANSEDSAIVHVQKCSIKNPLIRSSKL